MLLFTKKIIQRLQRVSTKTQFKNICVIREIGLESIVVVDVQIKETGLCVSIGGLRWPFTRRRTSDLRTFVRRYLRRR